eukprot:c1275_g1_i1 orf=228-1616(-)
MGCTYLGIILIIWNLCVLLGQGFPISDLVLKLPGQPEVQFHQYGGYITVDAKAGRALFYYFVEAEDAPRSKPLTLWLNGGPGCSSIGGGAFTELGPFYPSGDGRGLQRNNKSWNKASNLLFLESPAGVGWSYSNTTSDYMSFGDSSTARDSLVFLLKWFEKFPEYKNNDFYLAGESYAGHYVPQLASCLLEHSKSSGFKFNLKGLAIGNPLLKLDVDALSSYNYLWSHGIIPDETYHAILRSCDFEDYTLTSEIPNVTKDCYDEIVQANLELGEYINNYDVILDVCYPSLVEQELRLRQKVSKISLGVDVCMTNERTFYFNLPETQNALHANATNLPYRWSMCSGVLDYDLKDSKINMIPVLKYLYRQGLRVWVFSGDQDSVVPLIGTRTLIYDMAQDLGLPLSAVYRAWYHERQVGGWMVSFGNLTFATVRGAAHMVPYSQPSRALLLFESFLSGNHLPKQ